MRILIAAHGFPPRQAAGAEWRAHRTARELLKRGHAVHVLAVDSMSDGQGPGSRTADEVVDGIGVQRVSFDVDERPGAVTEFDNPFIGSAMTQMIESFRPDVVHVISGYRLGAPAIERSKAAAVPVVVTLTDFWFLCPLITLQRTTGERCTVPPDVTGCVVCLAGQQRRARLPHRMTGGWSSRLLERVWAVDPLRPPGVSRARAVMQARRTRLHAALLSADRLIAPSQFLRQMFATQGVSGDRVVTMRQGIDVAAWLPLVEPAKTEAASSTGPDSASGGQRALRIGFIGQISEHKGVFDLVRAFRSLIYGADTVRLVIFGDLEKAWPPMRERLRREVAHDPRIELAGRFARDAVRRVHARLDVLVVPSRWYENSPNVILEAFACGTPVIASNLGGMAELVDDGVNGLLFEPGNVQDLARRLHRFVDDPALGKRLRAGIPPVRTVENEMDELVAVYEDLLRYAPLTSSTTTVPD